MRIEKKIYSFKDKAWDFKAHFLRLMNLNVKAQLGRPGKKFQSSTLKCFKCWIVSIEVVFVGVPDAKNLTLQNI